MALTARTSTENNSLANFILSRHRTYVKISTNKGQIMKNVLKCLAFHFFSFHIALASKIGVVLSVPSEGTADQRDVSVNDQVTTGL